MCAKLCHDGDGVMFTLDQGGMCIIHKDPLSRIETKTPLGRLFLHSMGNVALLTCPLPHSKSQI